MTIIVDGQPTFIIPVFQQTGFIVQYKPFASFYQWTDFLDFTEFDTRITAIEASIPADFSATLAAILEELTAVASAASDALAVAASAAAAAAAAQSTADSAILNAAAAQTTANGAVIVNTTQATAITAAAAAAAAAQATANNNTTLLPRRGHFHNEEQSVITGTEARNQDATLALDGGKYTSTQNAHIEHYLTCRAGTNFTVSVASLKSSGYGTVTVYLDGNLILTQDLYAAATVLNFIFGVTANRSVVAGDHTLAFKCLGKNPSASAYLMFINFVKWIVF